MNKEVLQFSKLQPVLSVIFIVSVICYFSNGYNLFFITHNFLALVVIMLCLAYVVKIIRIGYLTVIGKPAIVLTDESIFITAMNDDIKWKDMSDVYMTSGSVGVVNLVKFKFITIKVREPEKYLKAIKNPIVRNYRWFTRNWRQSSFEISLFFVKGDDDEIYQLVLSYYQNLRGF